MADSPKCQVPIHIVSMWWTPVLDINNRFASLSRSYVVPHKTTGTEIPKKQCKVRKGLATQAPGLFVL